MLDVLSREQIREFDRFATSKGLVPSALLMENAGRGAVDAILSARGEGPHRVLILCGPGNNGGDGFVVARRLLTLGHAVRLMLTAAPESLRGDAKLNHDAWLALGGEVQPLGVTDHETLETNLAWCQIAIDGLMGTGLARELTGNLALIVTLVNAAKAFKVALDIPTGLDANSGQKLGVVLQVDLTVTFAHAKLGLYGAQAKDVVGSIVVADIGVPPSISDEVGISATITERRDVQEMLTRRLASTHKGLAGRVVVVGGSSGKTGAALLASHAALRAGAGLCTIACFEDAAPAVENKVLEVMTHTMSASSLEDTLDPLLAPANAVVIGPGIGLDARARAVVDHVVLTHPGLVVVDADALSHFAGRTRVIASAQGPRILTPHPGEMARLLGMSVAEAESNRFQTLRRAVELTGAHVVFKGENTLCATREDLPCINPTGSAVLATAGAGDVLSGIIAALACNRDAFEACVCGTFVHGLAGEWWARESGSDRGMLAREIADRVPLVLGALLCT